MPSTHGSERREQTEPERAAPHPHLTRLLAATCETRDLADAVHLLCHVHGRHPGLISLALEAGSAALGAEWLTQARDVFERERLYLVRLASAVGPQPSTPGAIETENSMLAQHHALETLARSERPGCALGAATALVAQWAELRPMLDRAAARAGLEFPACALPGAASIQRAIEHSVVGVSAQRALAFGAEQMRLQHRGLLDLLQARADARADT